MTAGTEPVDPLIAEFERTQWARNGIPDDRTRADRHRCLEVLRKVLGEWLGPAGIAVSPLGVDWTEVFDVHLRRPVDPARLTAAGWLPVDSLIGDGPPRRVAPRRWAVLEDGRVLAGVRFVDGPADPVRSILEGCRERSEVRLREVLELRRLVREGRTFPVTAAPLRAAAEIESGLGGRLLAPWASGRSVAAPAPLAGRRRLVLALSGVDGSGKSTLRAALAEGLGRAGVPVSTVWVRPGMGMGRLTALAAWGKRLLRQDAAPGVRAMADPAAPRPASRRGAVGYAWSLIVSCSFLVGVWRQHRSARGVVLYDRHLVDALATLDFAYDGVDLRLQHRLVRALLPRADVRLYLDVPADVSVARKPDDVLGEHAVRSQLAAYARWLDRLPPTVRLDATRPTGDLVTEALHAATATENTGHKRRRRR
jgi:thymidylate kinase